MAEFSKVTINPTPSSPPFGEAELAEVEANRTAIASEPVYDVRSIREDIPAMASVLRASWAREKALRATVKWLRELQQFVQHMPGCPVAFDDYGPCNCGLEEVLAKEPK